MQFRSMSRTSLGDSSLATFPLLRVFQISLAKHKRAELKVILEVSSRHLVSIYEPKILECHYQNDADDLYKAEVHGY